MDAGHMVAGHPDAGQSRTRMAGWFLLWTALLYAGFCHDVFGVTGARRSLYVGPDSYLVFNRLALDARQGVSPWHCLVFKIDDPTRPGTPYVNYTSQFGLSGVALNAVSEATGLNRLRVGLLASEACGLLTAAVFAAFLVAFGREFGQLSAGLAAVLLAGSPQLIYQASSVYWCCFLMFAPFVLTWVAGPALLASRRGTAALLGLLFALNALKCLCGYEYVTTVVLSPLPALLYHDWKAGRTGVRRLGFYALVVGVGCAGFVAAFALHAAQLKYVLGYDPVEVIGNRVRYRLGKDVAGFESFDPGPNPLPFLSDRGWLTVRGFFRYFALNGTSLPGLRQPSLTISIWWLAAATIAFLALAAARWRRLPRDRQALTLALAASVPCALSWQFVARNHMIVHIHLNLIVFYLPWLPLLFARTGLAVAEAVGRVAAQVAAAFPEAPALSGEGWRELGRRLLPFAPAAALAALIGAVFVGQDREFVRRVLAIGDAGPAFLLASGASPAPQADPRFLYALDGIVPADDRWTFEMQRSALPRLYGLGGGGGTVFGWAVDGTEQSRPVRIVVTRNGSTVGEATTGNPRPDVAAALGIANPATGFAVSIPEFTPGDEAAYRIFALPAGPGPADAARRPEELALGQARISLH